jgi:hypothetical protein
MKWGQPLIFKILNSNIRIIDVDEILEFISSETGLKYIGTDLSFVASIYMYILYIHNYIFFL